MLIFSVGNSADRAEGSREESMTREKSGRRTEGARPAVRMDGGPAGLPPMGARLMAPPPPHPMTAEQDRYEDADGPFDDGVR